AARFPPRFAATQTCCHPSTARTVPRHESWYRCTVFGKPRQWSGGEVSGKASTKRRRRGSFATGPGGCCRHRAYGEGDVRRATGVSIAAGIVLAFGTTPARAEEPHVTGVYLSNRLNADGSQYQGLVYVVRDHDTFLVSWMDLQSKNDQLMVVQAAAGVGLVEGRVFA